MHLGFSVIGGKSTWPNLISRYELHDSSLEAADSGDKPRTQQPTRVGRIQTFRPQRASNRLDGSPRSESGKPARHIGAIAFILGSEAFAERRLLIGNYGNVKNEPEQRAVAEEMPVSE